jgi:hypothetical protein
MTDWRFEIAYAKQHLRLEIDDRHDAIVWAQKSLLTALCETCLL